MSISRITSNSIADGAISASDIANDSITSDKISGTITVSKGGTGASSLTANAVLLGNGSSSITTVSAGTVGNVLTSTGTVWISQALAASGGLAGSQSFNSPGTFSTPPNTNQAFVILSGGGGGGGGIGRDSNLTPRSAFPGGAGGFAVGVVSVTGGSPVSVTVGAGGAAGVGFTPPFGSGNPGGNGGASSFGNLISANGGSGGDGGKGNPPFTQNATTVGTATSPTGLAFSGGSPIGLYESAGFGGRGTGGLTDGAGANGFVFIAF